MCRSQAVGSWSVEECCKISTNICNRAVPYCWDQMSSADFIFGLAPGPPVKFGPTGADRMFQAVEPGQWPHWGSGEDLFMGGYGPPGTGAGPNSDQRGYCDQGFTYGGLPNQICGGGPNGTNHQGHHGGNGKVWGTTQLEVLYPVTAATVADEGLRD